MEIEFKEIYNMLNDGTMLGANFVIKNNYIKLITLNNEDERLVDELDDKLFKYCNDELLNKGYKIIDSFIYYDRESDILTFEIEKREV